MPQLNRVELHQANFFLGAVLALLSLLPVVYLEITVLGHYVLATTLVSAALAFPRLRIFVPVELWRSVPLFLVLTFLLDLALFAGLGNFLDALIRLNILLVCYRSVAFRRRRDDPQLILLCLFLVIVVAVTTVSVFFVMQIVAFAALSMVLLFNANLLGNTARRETPEEIWGSFSWRHFLMRLGECLHLRLFGIAVALFLLILSLSAAIFLLIPRLNLESRIGFLGMRNAAGVAGFNEQVGLRDITNILNDHRTALRIDPPSRRALPTDPYWRMLVLDEYYYSYGNEGRFRVSDTASSQQDTVTARSLSPGDLDWEIPDGRRGDGRDWLFYLEGDVARWLPLAGDFETFRARGSNNFVHVPPFRVIGQSGVNSQLFFYQVTGMQFQERFYDPYMEQEGFPLVPADEAEPRPGYVRVPSGPRTDYRTTVLDLPVSDDERAYLLDVVDEITGGESLEAEAFAERAKGYLARNHDYSLSSALPPGDGDPIVRWLESRTDGHCEYFAGALLLLSRAAGYPARLVTGFHGGTWNSYEDYLMVRFSDAHAWCEIYSGDGYWFRADPTPSGGDTNGVPDERNDFVFGVSIDESWMAFFDSLRVLWYRRVVSFDEEAQSDLASNVRESLAILRDGTERGLQGFAATVRDWVRGPWSAERLLWVSGGLLILAGLFYVARRVGWRILPYVRLHRPHDMLDPVRRQAGVLLGRLEYRCAQRAGRLPVPDSEVNALRLELQFLRYGSPERRQAPGKIFLRARSVLKRLRKGRSLP